MTADMTMVATGPSCTVESDAEYDALIAYASLMVLVWVIGGPLGLFFLLFSRRTDIEARATRKGGKSLQTISFLFRVFKPRCKLNFK